MSVVILILITAILSVFWAMVFAGHYFIYFSVKKFFGLEKDKRKKIWLATALFFLAISFGVASAVAHWSENTATKVFYFGAGLWLGAAINFDAAFFLGWLAVGAGKIFKKKINLKTVGAIAVAAALIFSAYGVWSAYSPKIKEITVKIKNLPTTWQGKTAVQISDLHLGHVFGKKFFENTVEKVNALNPKIVFITGDLFDGMDGDLASFVSSAENFLAPAGAYFVTGNHETYLGLDRTYAALATTKIRALKDEVENVDGLQIIGVAYPEQSETKEVDTTIGQMVGFNSNEPSVLLYHSPFEVDRARRAGVSLMLSGHTHEGQVFPFGILAKIIFRGYDYGLHQEENFAIYTSSGLGVWGTTMRTFARPEIVVITFENQ
jgi:predicted MPP superfamily phosphohydrolase